MTLGNALAAKVRLIAWCKTCRHRAEPDIADQVAHHDQMMNSHPRGCRLAPPVVRGQRRRTYMAMDPSSLPSRPAYSFPALQALLAVGQRSVVERDRVARVMRVST